MRSSVSFSILTLKHQHSDLPWLRPHVFGSPQDGQTLGSVSTLIGSNFHASTEAPLFRARSEQWIAVVFAQQAAEIVALRDARGELQAGHVRDDVARRRGCNRALGA